VIVGLVFVGVFFQLFLFVINFQRVDERLGEGGDIFGFAAGDQVAVDGDLLIDHLRAGVFKVDEDRRPAGDSAAIDDLGLNQQPRFKKRCGLCRGSGM
jgi:hypothetical protein